MMSSEVESRTPYIGALMLVGWQWVRAKVFHSVVAAGYHDLNPAHVGLFRYPTVDRLHPSEIAERMQITKQSVHDLLGHLEHHGYLVREPDPSNRRARIIHLTSRGRQLELEVRAAARQAEDEIAALLGPSRFTQLRDTLETLAPMLTTDTAAAAPPGLDALDGPSNAVVAKRLE